MTLEAKLKDIREKLKNDRNFPNESSISQGIVLPILQELNWDIFNTKVVRPENITLGKDRADFALCDDSGNLKVFIEVKRLGGVDKKAEKQVMGYAQDKKVRIAVLTDGRTWSVYLPLVEGSYEEKLLFKLDLSKSTATQESSEVLQRYLEQSRVVLDKALKTAYVFFFLKKHRKDELGTWEKTVEPPINQLMYAVMPPLLYSAGQFVKKISPKSAQDDIDHDIVDYFHSLLRENISQSSSGKTAQLAQPESGGQVSASPSPEASERKQSVQRRVKRVPALPSSEPKGHAGEVKVVIDGKSSYWQDQSDAMAGVFKELQKRDRNFCQEFYKQPGNHGRTRLIIAQDPRGLYKDDSPSLQNAYRELGGGWFISTSHSWERKKKIIQLAAEVAGLKFGKNILFQKRVRPPR